VNVLATLLSPRLWCRGATLAVVVVSSATAFGQEDVSLPNRPDSLKFAVIGDFGTGLRPEYLVARQMEASHATFPFDLVMTVGDNIYGARPPEVVKRFELPFAALLADGVKFHAALGNHDAPENVSYKPFNMSGQRYYTFAHNNVRVLVLDSTQMDAEQRAWTERTLSDAREDWKICFLHHPLYSSAVRHGPALALRAVLEPIFVKYGVNVVFSGHDHVYERVKPQKGVVYFVTGSAGQLRFGNVSPGAQTAAYFDADRSFMLVEVAGSELYFQAVSRTGTIVDSGVIQRR
jgi:hypothetical protein